MSVTDLARLAELEAAADAAWEAWGQHWATHCNNRRGPCGEEADLAAQARHADMLADQERMGTAAGCGRAAHEKRA